MTDTVVDVRTVNFRYDEVEDRLFLDCIGAERKRTLLLTRRIARRLLHVFANALASSSPSVNKAPADARREVIALEHFSSLAVAQPKAAPAGEPEQAGDKGSQPVSLGQDLVWKVDVEIQPTLFRILLHSITDPLASLTLTRGDFHKLLAALDRWSVEAEWDIHGASGWLAGAEQAISGAGRTAS
jgi:hypothetical protein